MSYTDRIKPDDKSISRYLDELMGKDFQIPTFQRDVVWEEENVKKLWDSIYKFYPLGSILIWKTDIKLQNHRSIGGHEISDEEITKKEYQYILDGQQRTTSLLTSLYGGKIEGRDGFDPSLYIDLTVEMSGETDDESYKKRFLYWDEINDKNGTYKRNIRPKKKYDEGFIVKLKDVKDNFSSVERKIVESKTEYQNYDHPIRESLRRVKQVLDSYKLSFIFLRGISVSEVCQIFERINQSGRPLDIFDIVVAKTFTPITKESEGFYLRDMIQDFRKSNNSKFLQISDFDYLQMLAIIIRENIENSGIHNITNRYLNDIKTEQIEEVWEDVQKAILKTFDFFENTLLLKGPQLIPYRYFYLTISNYFFRNKNPNYDLLKKYFWFYSMHKEDLLSNTQDISEHLSILQSDNNEPAYKLKKFVIDKKDIRESKYSSKGRISRTILSLYANKNPKDWERTDRNVIVDNLFFSTDKPNLHHIFPTNYVAQNPGKNTLSKDSLMNIAYLTQLTNLDISDANPLKYFEKYDQNPDFEVVLKSHLIPTNLLSWVREQKMPPNALDEFIESRVDLVIEELRKHLGEDIEFSVIDSK